MKMNKKHFLTAVLSVVFMLSGTFAYAEPTANGVLTPSGNANLTDNISGNENLQFITVTSKDGNTFYFVIDKSASANNVYFLNTVDDSDLAALTDKQGDTLIPGGGAAQTTASPAPAQQQTPSPSQEPEKQKSESNNMYLIIILVLALIGGAAAYYFKVLLPKKKLSEADDIEDYEFVDEPDEATVIEEDTEDEE